VVDSIYEHIHQLGPGGYLPPALVPGLEDRTITVNALSKSYAVTGWRVGWAVAPAPLTAAIRKVHDFLTIAAPAPLQAAGVAAMALPPAYYAGLALAYRERRDLLCDALERIGFDLRRPDGSYYVLCDTGRLDPDRDGVAFARRLITEIGVSCVPAGSFWRPENAEHGRAKVRFAFPKRPETLHAAIGRLEQLAAP
jgi:aminotransferase